jgi:tyrosyl-tRNA synthetase
MKTIRAEPPKFLPVEQQLIEIRRGVEEIIPEEALVEKLERSYRTGRPLNVKLGCDPSRPDLHIGHAVVLRKLRQFQDLGHQAILIIGDFTGMIGDPSGRSKTRPALTAQEAHENGATYVEQAGHVLDVSSLQIRYNSEWLGAMSFTDVIKLASRYTVARMLERDDFENRYKSGQPISVHEFLYPLAQAQDSVAIEADVELGGTDQKFNLLVGRDIQQANDMDAQVCITMPILPGTDGVEKMSKSYDNYIGISEAPEDMYGKTLSIPDDLIYRYFELATAVDSARLPELKKLAETDPRNAKHELAFSIVQLYHGKDAAQSARDHFEKTIIRKEEPDDMPEFSAADLGGGTIGWLDLMHQTGLVASKSEARRMIQQGAVSIDGDKVTDVEGAVDLSVRAPFVVKVGKRRFARIVA